MVNYNKRGTQTVPLIFFLTSNKRQNLYVILDDFYI